MKIKKAVIVGLVALMVTACAEQGGPFNKQQIGTVMGAVGGAAAGSQFGKGSGRVGMIALGTLAGAALGGSLGASLDKVDQQYAGRTTQQALEVAPTGQVSGWKNPDSGNSGTVVPTRTYQQGSSVCREYRQTIIVGGRSEQAFGRACRQGDGSWQIVQ